MKLLSYSGYFLLRLLGVVKKELRNEPLMRKSVSRGIILPGGNELDMCSPVYVRAFGKLALSEIGIDSRMF